MGTTATTTTLRGETINLVISIMANCRNFKIMDLHEKSVNHVQQAQTNQNPNWILDSGESSHVTNNFSNLSLYSNYGGLKEVIFVDGISKKIDKTGLTTLVITLNLTVSNVLVVPTI